MIHIFTDGTFAVQDLEQVDPQTGEPRRKDFLSTNDLDWWYTAFDVCPSDSGADEYKKRFLNFINKTLVFQGKLL